MGLYIFQDKGIIVFKMTAIESSSVMKSLNFIYMYVAAVTTIIAGSFLALSLAQANGHYEPAKVIRVGVDASGRGFIALDVSASTAVSTPPSCSTNTFWHAAFDATTEPGKAILSLALSAKLSGQNVRLIGNNVCNGHSSIEGIYVLDLAP